jgi:hypothetical protein
MKRAVDSLCVPLLLLVVASAGQARARSPGLATDAPLASQATSTSETEVVSSGPMAKSAAQRTWTAFSEVTASNVVVWWVDRYLLDKDYARISLDSMKRNFEVGLIWDADPFGTNQFAHPYHGSVYYNAARDNGFGYFGASLFTFLGSLQWEMLAETEYPSGNDLINTSLGGIVLGEVLHRLSLRVLDNRAVGMGRFGRELSGGLLSPARGFNRVIQGEAWRIGPTPPEWRQHHLSLTTRSGYLRLANGEELKAGTDRLFVQLALQYGDPVYDEIRQPFDAFQALVQLVTVQGERIVSHAEVQAMLASTPLMSNERERLVLGLLQHYYYANLSLYEIGAQSLGGSVLYARGLSEGTALRAGFHLKGVVLGGLSSEHAGQAGRSYDYGPGLNLAIDGSLMRGSWALATAQLDMAWMHTLNGSDSNHLILAGRFQVDVPVYRSLGLGAGLVLFRRASNFRDYEDITQNARQLRVFLSLH